MWWLKKLLETCTILGFFLWPAAGRLRAEPPGKRPFFSSYQPDEIAAKANEQLEAGLVSAACSTLLETLQDRPRDPWIYRGAAICAAVPSHREGALQAVDSAAHDPALVAFTHGFLAFVTGQYHESAERLRRATELAPDFVLAWNALGAAALAQADPRSAAPSIARALELAPDFTVARLNLGRIRFQEAQLMLAQGQPAAALERFRGARDAFARAGDAAGQGQCLGYEGQLLLQLGDPEEALRSFREARPLLGAREQLPARANAWVEEAKALIRLGQTATALEALAEARQLSTSINHPIGLGSAWGWEGQVLIAMGRPDEALAAFREARRVFEGTPDLLSQAHLWLNEADILGRRGQWRESRDAARKGRSLAETVRDPTTRARSLWMDARASFELGDDEQALEAYDRARDLFQGLGDQESSRMAQAELAAVRGDFSEALSVYREAWTLAGETSPMLLAQFATSAGDVLVRHGSFEPALQAYRDAQNAFTALEAVDPVARAGLANVLMNMAKALHGLGQRDNARNLYRQSGEIYKELGNQEGLGHALLREAGLLISVDHGMALNAFSRSRQAFAAIEKEALLGDAYKGEALMLELLGRNQEALQAYRQARRFFRLSENEPGEAEAWQGEGDVLTPMGRYVEALEAYRAARGLFERHDDLERQGETWTDEGLVLGFMGDWEGSTRAYDKARELAREPGEQGWVWMAQAINLYMRGLLGDSLQARRSAAELFEAADDREGQAMARFMEAELLTYLELNHEALAASRRAQRAYEELTDAEGLIAGRLLEAHILQKLGKKELAKQTFVAARSLLEATDIIPANINSILRMMDFLEASDVDDSLRVLRRARDAKATQGDRLAEGMFWLIEAMVLIANDDSEGSLQAVLTAERLLPDLESFQPMLFGVPLIKAAVSSDDPGQATEFATDAIDRHSRMRSWHVSYTQRASFDEAVELAYDLLIPEHGRDRERVAKALTLAEQARSRAFLDFLAAGRVLGGSAPPELLSSEKRLRGELARIESRLRSANDAARRRELLEKRERLDASLQWNRFQRLVAQPGARQRLSQPLKAPAIQQLARDSGAILVFYVAESETVGFLVRPDSPEIVARHIDWTEEKLATAVGVFANAVSNPTYDLLAGRTGKALWRKILEPFTDALPPSGPLTVIPHGPLHELPFDALIDPASGEPLFERWQLSVVPSASTLEMTRRKHRPMRPDDRFLALASGSDLSQPMLETFDIASAFSEEPSILRPDEAHFQSYKDHAARARQLFIATRGVQQEVPLSDSTFSIYSYLEIQPTEEVHDHRLTAGEIATVSIDAELVTLAACDTAGGRTFPSDDRMNLTRSFLLAGTAAVLATRWRVPESHMTSRFLADFYRFYRQGGPDGRGQRKDHALAEARRASRGRGEPAQLWAAWVLVGDPR